MEVTLNHFLFVSGLLFAIGLAGVLVRRNVIVIFMCLELMLSAASLSLVAFSRFHQSGAGETKRASPVTDREQEQSLRQCSPGEDRHRR